MHGLAFLFVMLIQRPSSRSASHLSASPSEAIYNWERGGFGYKPQQTQYAQETLDYQMPQQETHSQEVLARLHASANTAESSATPQYGYRINNHPQFVDRDDERHFTQSPGMQRFSDVLTANANKGRHGQAVTTSESSASAITGSQDFTSSSLPAGYHLMDTHDMLDLGYGQQEQAFAPTESTQEYSGTQENTGGHILDISQLKVSGIKETPRSKPVKKKLQSIQPIRASSRKRERNHEANTIETETEQPTEEPVEQVEPEERKSLVKKGSLAEGAREWSYEDEDNWGRKFPTCDGFAQSPINIHPNSLFEENRLTLNLMNSYNSPISEATLMNNGHTVQLTYQGGPRPTLTGTSCFGDAFLFEQMHFHWGSKNTIGSEHSVFGQKFPLEMHLVHFNQKYGSMNQAADKPDGLVVLAIFFQVSDQDNPRFQELISSFRKIRCGGQSIKRNNVFNLSWFLPANRKQFYRYSGSLTTPPCHESVNWIIFKHGLLIGRNQMKQFRDLRQEDCKTPILNNWRNIQGTNGRRVDRALVSHARNFAYAT